jgi:hypothetical protein
MTILYNDVVDDEEEEEEEVDEALAVTLFSQRCNLTERSTNTSWKF